MLTTNTTITVFRDPENPPSAYCLDMPDGTPFFVLNLGPGITLFFGGGPAAERELVNDIVMALEKAAADFDRAREHKTEAAEGR